MNNEKNSFSLLEVDNITKKFGGLKALSKISFKINQQEIFGLIGPNGAGKTTLFNTLTGIYNPDHGCFRLDGKDLTGFKPHLIVKAGLARTFQNIRLFNQMTPLENVMVGRHVRTSVGAWGAIARHNFAIKEERLIKQKSRELLDYVGLEPDSKRASSALSYGDQRRLEIARALATEPKVVALDEPAAGMNPRETSGLRELLVRIKALGVTILIIEHDVKLVMGLCDRVAVLNYGKKIASGPPEEIKNNDQVIEAYLGGHLNESS